LQKNDQFNNIPKLINLTKIHFKIRHQSPEEGITAFLTVFYKSYPIWEQKNRCGKQILNRNLKK